MNGDLSHLYGYAHIDQIGPGEPPEAEHATSLSLRLSTILHIYECAGKKNSFF